MGHSRFEQTAAVALASLALIACQTAPPAATPSAPTPPRRPNFVLIVTDDLDTVTATHMPNLLSLVAARGVSFSNSFVSQPVCAPSRASLLTGKYTHNHGMLYNKPPNGGYKRFAEKGNEEQTIAVWLKATGYRTAIVGKYINRFPPKENNFHVPPGWTDWFLTFFPENYWNYRANDQGKLAEYGDTAAEYQTDVLSEKAVAFLNAAAADPRPFFLYLAPFAPHRPAEPAPRHAELVPSQRPPRPPSYNEEDVSDKPAWLRGLPRITPEIEKDTVDVFQERILTMMAVDEMVARLVRELEARGVIDNTFILFTSDNGFHFGAHRLDHGKGDPYDESIRVPLFVRGPGVAPRQTREHMVLNLDLAPTLADLAGAGPPPSVDGRSITELLGSSPPPIARWRQDILIEGWDSGRPPKGGADIDEAGGIPEFAAVRTRDHYYIEYVNGERELYDLAGDPYEMQSLHATAPKALLDRLSKRLAVLKACRGETCRE